MAIDKRFLYYTSEAGFLSDKNSGNISDSSIAFISVGGKKAIYTHGVFFSSEAFVVGTQTVATNAFTGTLNEIEKLYDGLSIKYWLPENGTTSNATLNLNINGTQTGAIPVYIKGTTRFTNHIGKYNVLHLTYRENVGSIAKGWWVLGSFGDKADGDTKYSFTSGTDGSFKVKASDGSAEQTISIGKPEEAGTADVAKKVEKAFTLQVNSGSTEREDLYTFDGSTPKTINIKQGSNIKIDTADGEISISGNYSDASQSAAGLMSSDDKTKLDKIEEGANKYIHPEHDEVSNGFVRVTVDAEGHVSSTTAIKKSDITALGIPSADTHYSSKNVVGSSTATSNTTTALSNGNVYLNSVENDVVTSSHKISGSGNTIVKTDASGNIEINSPTTIAWGSITGRPTEFTPSEHRHDNATADADGFMSSDDKSKLDGIASGATANKGTVTSVTISAGDGIAVDSTAAITSSGTRTISLNTATNTAIGGIIASNVLTSEVSLTGKNYGVQVDSTGKAFVNVPWENTTYTSLKNPNSLTIKYNDTESYKYDGSSAKTLNIKSGSNISISGDSSGNITISNTYSTDSVSVWLNSSVSKDLDTVENRHGWANTSGTNVASNLPTGVSAGTIVSFCNSNSKLQIFGGYKGDNNATPQGLYFRKCYDNTWDSWKEIYHTGNLKITNSVTNNSTALVTSGAVYTAITSGIKANDAMIFKGTLGTSGTITALPASHKIGDTYRVTTTGTYAGVKCEIGDLVICITAGTTANNAHWTVAQTNIDGAVTGPTSSTDEHIVVFNGTSGKSIKSSGKTIADLTYSSGTGLSLSDNTFSLAASGVTEGTYGPSSDVIGSEGSTISVPQIIVDKYGRITSVVNRTYTSKNTTYSAEKGIALSNGKFGLESSGVMVDSSTGTKTYGNTEQQSPKHGETFNIPYYTVDTYGRITSAGTTTVKLPASGNTDTKVNVTLATTSKAYLVGVTTTPTSTATAMTAVSDTGVYLDTTAGMLTATTFSGALSGNASSATYATNIRVTPTTDAKTYYPMWTTGTTANTNYVLRGNSNFRYNIVEGTTSAEGSDSIYLGNSTPKGTSGNSTGRLLLYSSSSSYHLLVGAATDSTISHTLPAAGGTILNTGTTSITQTVKSGTEIASIKIDNNTTKIYAPSIPSVSVTDEGTGTFVSDITSSNHTITVTRLNSDKGSTTKPVYFNSTGVLSECSVYAGGTAVTLNGSDLGASTASFYAPASAGTEGQVLVSNGSGAPSWQDCGGKVESTTASVAIGTSWGTLLSATKLGTLCSSIIGTYAIQIYGPSSIGYSSGIFTWNSANSGDANEILLHRTGASTSIYLRMAANRTLQIAGSEAVSSSTITIKIKRLI